MPKIKTTAPIHDTPTGYDFTVDTPLRPLRAIRMKCAECCCGNLAEVRRCAMTDCTLWPYRLGKRPVESCTPNKRAGLATNRPDEECGE